MIRIIFIHGYYALFSGAFGILFFSKSAKWSLEELLVGRGGCEQPNISHHPECILEVLYVVSHLSKKRASEVVQRGLLKGRRGQLQGSPGRERPGGGGSGQKKSSKNASQLLSFPSNTQLCLIFLGPISWINESNEIQVILFCFHFDWEDQASKGRIISRLL